MTQDRIIAVGLLTERDIRALGATFERLWPVEDTPCFSQLLQAIDEADRELWRDWDARDEPQMEEPQQLAPRIPRPE